MIDDSLILAILAFLGMVIGAIVTIYWLKNRKPDPIGTLESDLKDRIKLLKQENGELINEVKRYKQKYRRLSDQEAPTIEADPENFEIADTIKKLAPKFKEFLPSQFQELLDDPEIINEIAKLAGDHPEDAKEFLKHFLTKPRGKENKSNSQSEYLPQTDPNNFA